MQKTLNYALPCGGNVTLANDNAIIHIESETKRLPQNTTPKLSVCTKSGNSLCLGSFAKCDGRLCLNKSYPVSYFEANNIFIDDISHFYISDCVGQNDSEKSDDGHASVKDTDTYTGYDDALKRAEDILNFMSTGGDFIEESKALKKTIDEKFSKVTSFVFPWLNGFLWIEMNDIRQTFGISALEHVMFNEFFVRAYAKSGRWYLGKASGDGLYAVCIECEKNAPNPMVNALDCAIEHSGLNDSKYFVVGIGLFSDGQYFYKIEN
ncbi:MAG: hypothetical protein II998_01315 [Clostridia bacterium]|nr:hypothetical protein [Clostridia bacterium]